jgi:hypothetical protein
MEKYSVLHETCRMYIKKYFYGVEKKLTAVSELVRYKVLSL